MQSIREKLGSRNFVQNMVFNLTGKLVMLMVGLVIGGYLKEWLF